MWFLDPLLIFLQAGGNHLKFMYGLQAQLKDRFRVFDGQSSFTGPCPSTQNPTAGGPYGSEANLNNRLLGANTVFCQGDFITGLWPFVKVGVQAGGCLAMVDGVHHACCGTQT
jgi:hypothetical protein